jgi:hypothetical protein
MASGVISFEHSFDHQALVRGLTGRLIERPQAHGLLDRQA